MPLEVLRIADHLLRTASPDDLAEVRRRLGERLSLPPLGDRVGYSLPRAAVQCIPYAR